MRQTRVPSNGVLASCTRLRRTSSSSPPLTRSPMESITRTTKKLSNSTGRSSIPLSGDSTGYNSEVNRRATGREGNQHIQSFPRFGGGFDSHRPLQLNQLLTDVSRSNRCSICLQLDCFWTWSTGIFARVEHSHAFRRVTHLLTNFQQKCTLSGRKYVPRNARVYCSKTATGGVLSVVER